MNKLRALGDTAAIPLFALSLYYLYNIQNKTNITFIIILFSFIGLVFDIVSSIHYNNSQIKKL